MIYNDDQIAGIIKSNPQKKLVSDAQNQANKLMTLIHVHNLSSALSRDQYFEKDNDFKSRKKDTMSNKDLFAKIFLREQLVLTAQGGASYFTGLSEVEIKSLKE